MNARHASLVVLSFALPAAAQTPASPDLFRIEGRVLLPDGYPAHDPVEIVLRRGSSSSPLTGRVLAIAEPDARGRFRLELERRERGCFLAIEARWLELRPLWIEAREGEPAVDVVLTPALRGILHGRFVAPEQSPFAARALAGSYVWIDGGELHLAEVDAQGEFELSGPAQCFAAPLEANPRGFAPVAVEAMLVEDGRQAELSIPLVEAAHVSGRVVDALDRGVAGVTLSLARGRELLQPIPLDPWGSVRSVTSTDDGSFEAADLPPGDLMLRVEDPRYRAPNALVAGLRAGEQREQVLVHLVRAAVLHGRIVDEYAEPVAGARVIAGASGGQGGLLVTTTDAQGDYSFDSVLPGMYEVSASSEGQAARTRQLVVLGEGEREDADLVLGRGSELRVVVREHEAPVFVRVLDAAGFLHLEQRAWQGMVSETLPPGVYTIEVLARDGTRMERKVPLTGREGGPVMVRM